MKNLKKSHVFLNIIIIASFSIFAFLNIFLFLHNYHFSIKNDMQFNLQRTAELLRNQNIFPQYALNSFADNGSAIMSMYPYLYIYLIAGFFTLTKSIFSGLILFNFLLTFVCLLISFYSSRHFSKNIVISYLFALLYTFSSSFLVTSYSGIMGMNFAALFMPLAIFGSIYWLRNNHWIMLSIGMSCVIYSNVLASTCLVAILFMILLINLKEVDINRIKSLIKAILLTILATAMFTFPFIKLILMNNIHAPFPPRQVDGINIVQGVESSVNPFNFSPVAFQLSLTIILGLIMGLIMYKQLSLFLKKMFLFSILILFISSDLVPWPFFTHTFFKNLQYPGRLLIFPRMFLTYILACGLYKYLLRNCNSFKITVRLAVLIFVTCSVQFTNQLSLLRTSIPKVSNTLVTGYHDPTISQATNYYPKSSLKDQKILLKDQGLNSVHKYVQFKPKGNGQFDFKLPYRVHNLSFPFLYYHGTNYHCYLDGKSVMIHSNQNDIMNINQNINHGHHIIKIVINHDKIITISRMLTILSLIIYALLLISYLIK